MPQLQEEKDSDLKEKKDDNGSINLKGLRTLDSDLKEYKRRLDKYGIDQASLYDPYLDIQEGSQLGSSENEISDVARAKETKKGEMREKESEHGEKIKEEEDDEGNPAEDNIPFVELIKRKKKLSSGETPPVYSPQIPKISLEPKTQPIKEAVIGQTPPKPIKPPQQTAPADIQAKEQPQSKEFKLREELNRLAKEHAEWKQKLEYYQKNRSKLFEERESLILKKNEIENVLNPILDEEKKLEAEIRKIEQEEVNLEDGGQRERGKERWAKEDRRKEIERNKWVHQANLKEVTKEIDDKNRTYETLIAKELEAENGLERLGKEKEVKEKQIRFFDIKKLKVDIESNKRKLVAQIKVFEDSIKRLSENRRSVMMEKNAIEEKEHQTQNTPEEKILEAKRWDIEDKLRKVEQELWQISDKQKRLLEIMADITGQHQKILKEEKEVLSKLEQPQIEEVTKNS